VEVADLPIVEYETFRGMIEGVFIVENALLQVVDVILIGLLGDGGVSLMICDGLE
jgi:hypothetical protein